MAYQPNNSEILNNSIAVDDAGWILQNTAILITHGIGDQLPLATVDQFGRGLVKQLRKAFGADITLQHQLQPKQGKDGNTWFDNVLRIQKAGSTYSIDIYEYYWANYTEDKATWSDLNKWLQGVVNGAKTFYAKNAAIGKAYGDQSIFFDKKTGAFNVRTYRFFLATASRVFMALDALTTFSIKLLGRLPLFGSIAASLLQRFFESNIHKLTNVLGDVVVYNVTDPKSQFYGVRRCILDGAVDALKFLIEKRVGEKNDKDTTDTRELAYPSVIVAAHSLGTQVSYDAINQLNLLVNQGEIKSYTKDGKCIVNNQLPISSQLRGYITFGSHLDKVVFFLRENVPDTEYIRQQLLDNYHGFKQRSLDFDNNSTTNASYVKVNLQLNRLLERIQWRNYWDSKDYVSGNLDYYTGLTNVDCKFKAGTFGFTHSYYWDCEPFFADIINHFLIP